MKKLATAVAVFVSVLGSVLGSAANAKTFVGVLWPMGGPLPAAGLVELVGEIKKMPDVEVETYLHQSWPSLVRDIDRQPPGTRTIVVGYSLGANSSTFVANNAKYVDVIIALQPSVFSWNPPVTGKVGRMIEIYNPNPLMTFGGMGSKKLVGNNIEYIANNDSHPGAQFSSQFRNLVKREIAKPSTPERVETAQADVTKRPKPVQLAAAAVAEPADERPTSRRGDANNRLPIADTKAPRLAKETKPLDGKSAEGKSAEGKSAEGKSAEGKPDRRQPPTQEQTAFLDKLSGSVNSGDLFSQRRLTVDAMAHYAERTYHRTATASLVRTASE